MLRLKNEEIRAGPANFVINTRNIAKDEILHSGSKTADENFVSPKVYKLTKAIDLIAKEGKVFAIPKSPIESFLQNKELYKMKRKGETQKLHISTLNAIKKIDLE